VRRRESKGEDGGKSKKKSCTRKPGVLACAVPPPPSSNSVIECDRLRPRPRPPPIAEAEEPGGPPNSPTRNFPGPNPPLANGPPLLGKSRGGGFLDIGGGSIVVVRVVYIFPWHLHSSIQSFSPSSYRCPNSIARSTAGVLVSVVGFPGWPLRVFASARVPIRGSTILDMTISA
jgi:hypothetical protein